MKPGASRYVPALGFHALTPLYDIILRITMKDPAFKFTLLKQAALRPGEHVLDVGCGTGTLGIRVAALVGDAGEVHGIDLDSAMLSRAESKAKTAGVSLHLQQGSATELPYPDARFDRALSSLFLHHLNREQKQQTLAGIHRVLKPGGQLHIADFGIPSNPLTAFLFFFLRMLDGFDATRDNVRGTIPELMRDAGFVDVHTQPCAYPIFGTMVSYHGRKAG